MAAEAEDGPRRSSAVPALLAVVALVLGGILVAGLVDGSRAADALRPGECLLAPDSDQVTRIDPVACTSPHELEVIGNVELDDGPYPGDAETLDLAVDACEAIFPGYVGEPFDESAWFINAFTPSAESWEAGNRTATCLVFQFDDNLEYRIVTGSARSGI